ncbi:hypothetical protein EON63_08050 [archaeon]|nr:MAG: hypothetical protein EON63_08050 [archaeon]
MCMVITLPPGEICCFPVGLLVDVSRHFLPLTTLFRVIDGMVASKLNKLHLHLTDAASFSILLRQTPAHAQFNLTNLIAKDPLNFALNKFYSLEQLHTLVQYAKQKGVEIIPEIDMPAHSLSWKHVFPGIIINCSEVASKSPTPENVYALDISNELVYGVVEAILRQVVEVFPSPYLHIGGDEVDENCYLSSPRLVAWAGRHNISSSALTKYFETRLFNMVYKLQKVPIVWQGVVDNEQLPDYAPPHAKPSATRRRLQIIDDIYQSNLADHYAEATVPAEHTVNIDSHAEKAIIMPWKCWKGMALKAALTALQRRHPIIMSACWYLDMNDDWTTYLHNPSLDTAKFNANMSLIYGGEGSLWTEKADHTSAQCRIYPRLGAIAYRLWGVGATLCPASYMSSYGNNLYAIYNSLHQSYYVSSNGSSLHSALSTQCTVRPNTTTSEVQLGLFATQILYSAYVTYHAYLTSRLHIHSHDVAFHLKIVRNREFKSQGEYVPYVSRSQHNSMR